MQGIRATVTATTDFMRARLAELMAKASDMSPAMREIARVLESLTRRRFELGQDPDGNAWKPSRRVLENGGQTLLDSGALRDSLVRASSPNSATVGTNMVYGLIHQNGGRILPRAGKALAVPGVGFRAHVDIPARPFIGFGAQERDRVGKIIGRHIGGLPA